MKNEQFWDGFYAGAIGAMHDDINEPFGVWPFSGEGVPAVKLPVAASPLTITQE